MAPHGNINIVTHYHINKYRTKYSSSSTDSISTDLLSAEMTQGYEFVHTMQVCMTFELCAWCVACSFCTPCMSLYRHGNDKIQQQAPVYTSYTHSYIVSWTQQKVKQSYDFHSSVVHVENDSSHQATTRYTDNSTHRQQLYQQQRWGQECQHCSFSACATKALSLFALFETFVFAERYY